MLERRGGWLITCTRKYIEGRIDITRIYYVCSITFAHTRGIRKGGGSAIWPNNALVDIITI